MTRLWLLAWLIEDMLRCLLPTAGVADADAASSTEGNAGLRTAS